MLERERERVAAASRRLPTEGLEPGTAGNVSERGGELVAITPTGAALEDVGPGQITVVDLSGRHVEGDLAASSELRLHLGIYNRYGAGGVVHTHAPIGTALSCVLDELPVIHYQMLLLGGPVRVARYAPSGSAELAEVTLEALEGRNAALMANHGTVAHAADLDSAVKHALLLEWACMIFWRAAAVGTPRPLSDVQQRLAIDDVVARGHGTTNRIDG